jgi:hypothetical protein
MAKAYESEALAMRVFLMVVAGVGIEVAVMAIVAP